MDINHLSNGSESDYLQELILETNDPINIY